MAFLTADDYKVLIGVDELNIVQQADADIRLAAEKMAQDEISSYLNTRYNTDAIFAATLDDRNQVIVMYMVDVTLYHLHANTEGFDAEKREQRYANAIEWLDKVANGSISPDLPYFEDEDGNADANNPIRYNSDDRNDNSW